MRLITFWFVVLVVFVAGLLIARHDERRQRAHEIHAQECAYFASNLGRDYAKCMAENDGELVRVK